MRPANPLPLPASPNLVGLVSPGWKKTGFASRGRCLGMSRKFRSRGKRLLQRVRVQTLAREVTRSKIRPQTKSTTAATAERFARRAPTVTRASDSPPAVRKKVGSTCSVPPRPFQGYDTPIKDAVAGGEHREFSDGDATLPCFDDHDDERRGCNYHELSSFSQNYQMHVQQVRVLSGQHHIGSGPGASRVSRSLRVQQAGLHRKHVRSRYQAVSVQTRSRWTTLRKVRIDCGCKSDVCEVSVSRRVSDKCRILVTDASLDTGVCIASGRAFLAARYANVILWAPFETIVSR